MNDVAAYVSVEIDGAMHRVGRLWARADRGRERAVFEYDNSWLKSNHRYALEPALSLSPGSFHTRARQALFGALGDSAPDRWGRNLIARNERRRAKAEKRQPRALREIDYLLAVADETRQGALRFATSEEGPFLAASGAAAVPPLVMLPKLLAAADKVLDDAESAQDLRLLLAPGSSLGGARPKASVRETDGSLLIAKFPASADEHRVVEWEAVALSLARSAGIPVPACRLVRVGTKRVLLLRRFDRAGGIRIAFLSAMSALNASDGEPRSYVEIADVLRTFGASVTEDLAALWRRIVFTVLITNTDDHLRNHGFLYAGQPGWRLSPAYDLNPVPAHIKPRVLSTAIAEDGDPSASLESALGVAAQFGLSPSRAQTIISEVAAAVRQWRREAVTLKITKSEIERMTTAFEHEDSRYAARL